MPRLAGEHLGSWDGVGLEVVVDLPSKSASGFLSIPTPRLTLAVYPGSVALKAPGILTVGLGLEFPPPETLICAQLI